MIQKSWQKKQCTLHAALNDQKAVYDFLKFTLLVNAQISERAGLILELKSTFKIK